MTASSSSSRNQGEPLNLPLMSTLPCLDVDPTHLIGFALAVCNALLCTDSTISHGHLHSTLDKGRLALYNPLESAAWAYSKCRHQSAPASAAVDPMCILMQTSHLILSCSFAAIWCGLTHVWLIVTHMYVTYIATVAIIHITNPHDDVCHARARPVHRLLRRPGPPLPSPADQAALQLSPEPQGRHTLQVHLVCLVNHIP